MILRAAWVISVTAAPIRDGLVEVVAGRIVRVGDAPRDDVGDEQVIDLGDAILTPGLVNPHTHLELSCYQDHMEPAPFWQWIGKLVLLRAAPGQRQRERQAVVDGAWQSLRAGVTCVGDISRLNLAWSALKPIPIRKVCFVELLSLADDPPRNPDELRAAVAEVVEDDLLTVGVSPHAPYTVPADHLRAAITLADELRRPWTIHLAETPEEVAFLRGERGVLGNMIERLLEQRGVESPRRTPTQLLADCVASCCPGALAHGNYVTDAEFDSLAKAGHTVVYCPRAHRFFSHSPHPLARLRAAGVRVAIGTDSLASNQSLSMLDELQFVHSNVADAPSPAELLRMATLDAARALNLDEQIGSLKPGKLADLAAFPCPRFTTDPVRALIENPVPPKAIWISGHPVNLHPSRKT